MKIIFNNLKNISILTIGELFSRLINFLSFAYLARIISVDNFGYLGFGLAVINFLLNLVSFGIDRICLRDIALNNSIANIYLSNITIIRFLLSVFSFIIYVFILFFNQNNNLALILLGLIIFTNGLSLNYFARALEKFNIISIIQIISSIITIIFYISFVKSNNDFLLVILIILLASLVSNILFVFYFKNYFNNFFKLLSYKLSIKIIKESFPIFLSTIMVSIYYFSDTIILGLLKPDTDVGIYYAANKIFLLAILPFNIIVNASLPQIANSLKKLSTIYFNFFILIVSVALILGFVSFIFSDKIIYLFFGDKYLSAIIPLKLLSLNVILVGINMALGEPLTIWGKQKQHLIAVSAGAFCNILLNIIFIPKFTYYGAAFTTLISEFIVFIALIIIFNITIKQNA